MGTTADDAPARPSLSDSYDLFKGLEAATTTRLDKSGIHIMRLDGRAFSTYTRGLDAPFDPVFAAAMDTAATAVAKDLGALTTYVASDEISLVFAARGERSELPFGGVVRKLLSLSAATVTAAFNVEHYARMGKVATFDARVITVENAAQALQYLTWRQADTYRNAVMMTAQTMFSHRELLNVGTRQACELIEARVGGRFKASYPARFYNGRELAHEVRTEWVTYRHSRTGEEHKVLADRGHWVANPAPYYRDLDADTFGASLGI